MYLVLINSEAVSGEQVLSPAVEKLQSFSYQLRSEEWSVLDCIPEKGALFEVHLGDKKHRECFDYVFAAMIAPDIQSAMRCIAIFGKRAFSTTIDWAEIHSQMPSLCALLYADLDNCKGAGRFAIKP